MRSPRPHWQQRDPRHREFHSPERFADWVLQCATRGVVKFEPDPSKQTTAVDIAVRDAMLRAFHRWPAATLARAQEACERDRRAAECECRDQVRRYGEDVRLQLAVCAGSLFEPDGGEIALADAVDTLETFLAGLRDIDGFLDDNWSESLAALSLPLRLQPLVREILGLVAVGHSAAASEAIDVLRRSIYDPHATYSPAVVLGSALVTNIGELASPSATMQTRVPMELRYAVHRLKLQWICAANVVIGQVSHALTKQWLAENTSAIDAELAASTESILADSFSRLSTALAKSELYMLQKLPVVHAAPRCKTWRRRRKSKSWETDDKPNSKPTVTIHGLHRVGERIICIVHMSE